MRNGRVKRDRVPGLKDIFLKTDLDCKDAFKYETILTTIVHNGLITGNGITANVVK